VNAFSLPRFLKPPQRSTIPESLIAAPSHMVLNFETFWRHYIYKLGSATVSVLITSVTLSQVSLNFSGKE
jgi:hypothetical protein